MEMGIMGCCAMLKLQVTNISKLELNRPMGNYCTGLTVVRVCKCYVVNW